MTNIFRQFIISSFDERWMNFSMHLACAKDSASMENVHHLRVATRRLLVLIALLDSILPRSKFEKLRKYLRRLRSNFNTLHDTQMIIDALTKAQETGIEADRFITLLKKSESRLHKDAIKVIGNLKPGQLNNCAIQIRQDLIIDLADQDFFNNQILPKLDECYEEIKTNSDSVDPQHIATIHNLRISYRKFRYMVEIVLPMLQGYPTEYLAALRSYQDMMGEIQNCEVVLTRLKEISKKVPKDKQTPVFEHFQTKYENSILTFMEHFTKIPKLWRDSKLSEMPWEINSSDDHNPIQITDHQGTILDDSESEAFPG